MVRAPPIITLCVVAGCAALAGIDDYEGTGSGGRSSSSVSSNGGEPASSSSSSSSVGGQGGAGAEGGGGGVGLGWLPRYFHRRTLTIAAKNVDGQFDDFPVAVQLTEIPNAQRPIVVTDSDGTTILPTDVERDDDTGLSFWFRAPELSSAADNVFYVYYDVVGTAAVQPAPKDVWINDFVSVIHCGDALGAGETMLLNSVTGVDEVEAVNLAPDDTQIKDTVQFGYSCRLNLAIQHLKLATSPATLKDLSVSMWARAFILGTAQRTLFANSGSGVNTDGIRFFVSGAMHPLQIEVGDGTVGELFTTPNYEFPLTDFDSVGFGYQPATNLVSTHYNSVVTDFIAPAGAQLSSEMVIGALTAAPNLPWATDSVEAFFDEIRVSSVVRSDEWIGATHRNLANPRSYAALGGEENVPQ